MMSETSEHIPLTEHASVLADQLVDDDLPALQQIHFLNGVIGIHSDPQSLPRSSVLGMYAADVSLAQQKAHLDPDSDRTSPIDKLYRRAHLGDPEGCDVTVLRAWRQGELRVIKPVTFPYAETPAFVEPTLVVKNIFKLLVESTDSQALQETLNNPDLNVAREVAGFIEPLGFRHRAAAISLGFMLFSKKQQTSAEFTNELSELAESEITNAVLFKLLPQLQPTPPMAKPHIQHIMTALEEKYPSRSKPRPKPRSHAPRSTTPRATRPRLLQEKYISLPERSISRVSIDESAGLASFTMDETKITFDLSTCLPEEDMSMLMQAWMGVSIGENGQYHGKTLTVARAELKRIRQIFDGPQPATAKELLCQHIKDGYVWFDSPVACDLSLGADYQSILNLLTDGKNQTEISELLSINATGVSNRIKTLKKIFGVPHVTDELLILAAYATGYPQPPAPNKIPFEPSNLDQEAEVAPDIFLAYPITILPPAEIVATRTLHLRREEIRSPYAPPREEGPYIHWGGGVFKRNFPDDDSLNQYVSRALSLHGFDLFEAGVGLYLDKTVNNVHDLIEEGRKTYNLAHGLGMSVRNLIDRGWLTVEQPMTIPPLQLHKRHVEIMQAIHTASSTEELAQRFTTSVANMHQLVKICRELVGVQTTRGLLTACFGMEFFKPEQYYREADIAPLPLAPYVPTEERQRVASKKATEKKKAAKIPLPPPFKAELVIPENLTVLSSTPSVSKNQAYPPSVPPATEDGIYLHWGGGVFKRNIPEAYELRPDLLRALALTGLGATTTSLQNYFYNQATVRTYYKQALEKTQLPGRLNLIPALFDRRWLTVEKSMPLPDFEAYDLSIYEEDIELLQLLHVGPTAEDIANIFGKSQRQVNYHMEHMRNAFGVSTTGSLLAAMYGMGLWRIGKE